MTQFSRRTFIGSLLIVVVAVSAVVTVKTIPRSEIALPDDTAELHSLSGGSDSDNPGDRWIDCVGVLHVTKLRGLEIANAQRFGLDGGTFHTTARIADLPPANLRAFCDWEACIRANGYAHVCALNDAGWEECRVCQSHEDCDGNPVSEDDCVAHATDPDRASCNVGLLQECLLQQAIRGPAYACVTETCRESAQACVGQLSGDLSAQAFAAQHETDQVTVEEFKDELALIKPDAAAIDWEDIWDGGPSSCGIQDGGSADATDDAGN